MGTQILMAIEVAGMVARTSGYERTDLAMVVAVLRSRLALIHCGN
jgi:hypothetical protein